MKTSTKGLLALMRREAVVLSAYRDTVKVYTIGVGHTAAAGDPAPVSGMKITLVQALSIFRRDIEKYEREVEAAVKVPLKQHEFDALVSFHYNTGGIKRAKLTEYINARRTDTATIKAGFRGWLTPPEIEGRRMEEFRQFTQADYGDTSVVPVYDAYPGKRRNVSTIGLLEDVPATKPPPDVEPLPQAGVAPAPAGTAPTGAPVATGFWSAVVAALTAIFRKDAA